MTSSKREVAQQLERLAQRGELGKQFLAALGLELRTSLGLVMGPLEDALAGADGLSAENRDRLELTHRNSLRLLELADTLLDASRSEEDQIEVSPGPAEVTSATGELASFVRPAAEPQPALPANGRLHRVLSDLAEATQPLTDPADIMATSARLLAEHLDVDRCAYAEVEDQSTYVITGDHTRGVASIVGRWELASFGAEHLRLMLAGEPYVVDDAEADPRVPAEYLQAYRATDIRAVVCVPLHKDGRLTAAMAVHQRTPRRWRPEEVKLVTAVVGRCWEALERARAEERLARVIDESERRTRLYEAILSATPDFVYVFSLDHRVLYANAALVTMWGAGDPVGKTFLELGYEPWHAEMHDREIDQVRATKAPIRGEVPFSGTTGRRIYDYIFVPVLGADGEVEAVAGTTRDVTDRKSMEEELRDADRRKDEFLAVLAHELRNPLAPLRNGLQVLRLAADDAVALADARAMMDRQLSHLVRLIDDLLDVSRINRNKMELRRSRVTLAEVVASAVETARPQIDEAGHELISSLPTVPVYLDADLTRLAQLFSNLLSNSAKYTPPGGRIWLSAQRTGDSVEVTVRDDGIGIPASSLGNIFDMFWQDERATGGLGIGLALVKGLVEMHGGTVTAESQGDGAGSTFTVTLPVLVDGAATDEAPASTATATSPRQRILVVDDNRDGADSLAMMLQLIGHEVRTANDGFEAIEAAERFAPEVILMDIGMPRMNGLDATRRIREQPWGRDVKIYALTGWGQDGDRAKSRAAGCDGHLVKPVHLPDLEKLLASG
jgi:PAS domain S-box-containing protein